ncbi:MAG: hypothetical protein ChlgKO_14880 [Chlamydiales bacterium]
MKKGYVLGANISNSECDIYADKSSIVLDWLLRFGVEKELFSLREVAAKTPVSLGLVQRVFKTLVFRGLLETQGLRTAKKIHIKKTGAPSQKLDRSVYYWEKVQDVGISVGF